MSTIILKPLIFATITSPEAVTEETFYGETLRSLITSSPETFYGETVRQLVVPSEETFFGNTLRQLSTVPIGEISRQLRIKWLIGGFEDNYTKIIPVLKTATDLELYTFCEELAKLVDGYVISYEKLDITEYIPT